jgi:tRNA-splicing endonuclease subunit Sen34
MIKITKLGDYGLIWEESTLLELKSLQICYFPIGILNNSQAFPALLDPIQVTHLVKSGKAAVTNSYHDIPTQAELADYIRNYMSSLEEFRAKKNDYQQCLKDYILKKVGSIDRIPSKPLQPVTIETSSVRFPWFRPQEVQWAIPRDPGETEEYYIFRILQEKGYYITTGSKFGGRFLLYPGI